MTGISRTLRKLALIGAAVALAAAAASVSVVLAYPKPISSALGSEWQCTRTAFVWTSCSRIRPPEAVVQNARRDAPCPRRRG
jgi:hypothetical protein